MPDDGCAPEDDLGLRKGRTLSPSESGGGGSRLCCTLSLSCSNLFLSNASVARNSALTCSRLSACATTPSMSRPEGASPSVR